MTAGFKQLKTCHTKDVIYVSVLLKRAVPESLGKVREGRFSIQYKEEVQRNSTDRATLHFPITENGAVGAE